MLYLVIWHLICFALVKELFLCADIVQTDVLVDRHMLGNPNFLSDCCLLKQKPFKKGSQFFPVCYYNITFSVSTTVTILSSIYFFFLGQAVAIWLSVASNSQPR